MNTKMKALPNIRMSFAISEKMKAEIDTIAAKRHINTSELIRDYIDKGMNVDKTASDMPDMCEKIGIPIQNLEYTAEPVQYR